MEDVYVVVVVRNTYDGGTYKISATWAEIHQYLNAMVVNEDYNEILAVVADGACLYSLLMAAEPITWRELVEFFA